MLANHTGIEGETIRARKTQSLTVKECTRRTLQPQGISEESDSATERTTVRIS